jgi:glycogen(starch) synthase
MKLLMTADAVGGVWTYAQELTAALASRGVETLVAVMGPGPSVAQLDEWSRRSTAKVVHRPYALEWMERPWADVDRAGEWLLQLARNFRPDVVHLNGYVHAALAWDAPCLVVAHSCVLTWWRAVHHEPAPPEWSEYRERIGAGLRAADHVVAPTHSHRSAMREEYPVPPRCDVIHNGRNAAVFPDSCAEGRSMVLGVGRAWDEAKNVATLDRAAEGLACPVYVAGDAVAFGTQRTFSFARALGRLEASDLRRRLGQATIFASPAVYEPFGLAVLEAALSRCALVLGDIPTMRELWEGAAVLVDPLDVQAWHAELRNLIADPARSVRLAALARERALGLSSERMAATYLDLYLRLLREAPAAAAPLVAPSLESGGLV